MEYVEDADGLTQTRAGSGLSVLVATTRTNENTGRFYLSRKYKGKNDSWYKALPMSTNRINEMMKRIVAGTPLESSCKIDKPQTVLNKLKKSTSRDPPSLKLPAIETYNPLTTTMKGT